MYPPYVPVAQRRAKAERQIQQLRKKNPHLQPVIIDGSKLAATWWGQSWNRNLERYADYQNRIGRGRSYVRHRAVVDLQIEAGDIAASVQGSERHPYTVAIDIDPLRATSWKAIRQACAGAFDSLRELLAGQFPASLKDLFFQQDSGLFPSPKEIRFDCSCPDWASMCKHVAAALYGVGARLDHDPGLFFTLRRIDVDELITATVADTAQALLDKAQQQSSHILGDVDLSEVFGIQFDEADLPAPSLPPATAAPQAPAAKSKPKGGKRRTAKAALAQTTRQPAKAKTARAKAKAARPANTKIASVKAAAPPVARMAPAASISPPPAGTMLADLVKAVGRARRGQSVDQLQAKLGWTRLQVRNTLTRASAKGWVELVQPGWYRRVL